MQQPDEYEKKEWQCFGPGTALRSCGLSDRHVKWQHHFKAASLPYHADHFDAAMIFLHDSGSWAGGYFG